MSSSTRDALQRYSKCCTQRRKRSKPLLNKCMFFFEAGSVPIVHVFRILNHSSPFPHLCCGRYSSVTSVTCLQLAGGTNLWVCWCCACEETFSVCRCPSWWTPSQQSTVDAPVLYHPPTAFYRHQKTSFSELSRFWGLFENKQLPVRSFFCARSNTVSISWK